MRIVVHPWLMINHLRIGFATARHRISTAMPNSTDWLHSGPGLAPRVAWAFNTDAELISLCQARETGDLFAVDLSGGMYRLNCHGRVQTLSRGLRNARLLK